MGLYQDKTGIPMNKHLLLFEGDHLEPCQYQDFGTALSTE